MDINRKNMDFLFQGFNTQFTTALEQVPDSWQRFCGVIQSGVNSDAAQKADKLIQSGKDALKGLFKKK